MEYIWWDSFSLSKCTVSSAGWRSSQEAGGSVDLVQASVEAHGPRAAGDLYCGLLLPLCFVCSGGSNKNGPHKFICLYTWSPVDGTVWERVGGVYYWRCALAAGF